MTEHLSWEEHIRALESGDEAAGPKADHLANCPECQRTRGDIKSALTLLAERSRLRAVSPSERRAAMSAVREEMESRPAPTVAWARLLPSSPAFAVRGAATVSRKTFESLPYRIAVAEFRSDSGSILRGQILVNDEATPLPTTGKALTSDGTEAPFEIDGTGEFDIDPFPSEAKSLSFHTPTSIIRLNLLDS